jgi:HipA-like protein
MRKGRVKYKRITVGIITELDNGTYEFEYNEGYLLDDIYPPVSLTLPKRKEKYTSQALFPFFFNMLSEGANKKMQCRRLKIDENDYFGLLLKTGNNETIGAVTVAEI